MPRFVLPVRPLACAALVFALAACGQSETKKDEGSKSASAAAEPASAAPAAIDPCRLLTKSDAKAALGAAVKDARAYRDVGFAPGTRCTYFTAAPIEVAGGVWSVSVEAYDAATFKAQDSYFKSPADYFRRNRDALRAAAGKDAVTDVPGIGTAAFWQPAPGLLHVLDRGVYLTLGVHADFHIPPGSSEQVHAAEAAAEKAAAEKLAKEVVLPRLEKL